jgi:DNA topoisomerase-1
MISAANLFAREVVMILVIVESPNKTKKIKAFLGAEYEVLASVGHIRDLPDNEMGVAAPDFKPKYVSSPRAKQIVDRLKVKAKKADLVIFATDPDREGEAIAWHLLDVLKPKKHQRVTFNAITKSAVLEAINKPRTIDMNLVYAQEGRRILDRLVGFTVSPLLKKMTNSPFSLSAGRVQTPAILLVVEREEAIANFKPIDYYKLKVHFPWPGRNVTWAASWSHKALQKALSLEETEHFADFKFVSDISKALTQQPTFMVVQTDGKEVSRKPPAPFSTSTLQQVANTKLEFGVDTTMNAAQKLFEEGLITYHRTDSLNLDPDSAESIRTWLKQQNLPIPEKPHRWDSKDGAQEAHEAIRPTEISIRKPEGYSLDSDSYKLYELIWTRTAASQMEAAKYFAVSVVLASALQVSGKNLQFVARGRTMLSPGWLELTPSTPGEDDDGNEAPDGEDDSDSALPRINKGDRINCVKGEPITATTKAPPRLTIATLVRELEANGIGRPSTYASIIGKIQARAYIDVRKRKIYATRLGATVIELVRGRFSFAQLGFTRIMESGLDKIAQGLTTYSKVITYQYDVLMREIDAILNDSGAVKIAQESIAESMADQIKCPVCNTHYLVRRRGTGSHFWSCSDSKECRAVCQEAAERGKPPAPDLKTIRSRADTIRPEVVISDIDCPVCKKKKLQRAEGKYGTFWCCQNFSNCRGRAPDVDGKPKVSTAV